MQQLQARARKLDANCTPNLADVAGHFQCRGWIGRLLNANKPRHRRNRRQKKTAAMAAVYSGCGIRAVTAQATLMGTWPVTVSAIAKMRFDLFVQAFDVNDDRSRRPRKQAKNADRLAGLLAVTVFLFFDAAQRIIDLPQQH